jgi:hypothetical protein
MADDGRFAALKGHVREGLYEMRTETDMSGVPSIDKSLPVQVATGRQCVRAGDVESGAFTRGHKAAESLCRLDGLQVSAEGASWTMRCDDMDSEVRMAFRDDGWTMELRTTSIEGPKKTQRYTTTQKLTARRLGPSCAD